MCFKNIKSLFFLFNVLFIFVGEILLFCIFSDYSCFIDRLATRLSSINILYVKLFQAFSLNNSLIDDKMNNKLLKFTDNAPWEISDIDFDKLRHVTNKYNIKLPNEFNVPINSGMISLVFIGHDNSNPIQKVVIKMKRKNIQQKLDEGIDNLLFLMYILSFIPIINQCQIEKVINKNIEIIKHQTNFFEEIENMDKIRENCKHLKYVKIPEAVKEVTNEYPDFIFMNYIEGVKINEVQEEDYEGFAKLVVKFGLVTSLLHGLTHGDLHGGNILFIKDDNDKRYPYKIGVIDFGIIYNVETQYKGLMFDILTQMFEKSPVESAEKILNSGILHPPGIMKQIPQKDYDNILSFTASIINETIYSSKKANQLQIYKFLSTFKEYLSKDELSTIGISPSDEFVKSQLVLAMSHGVTMTLCKGDYITLIDKVLNELFNTKIFLE
jgi:predicted unusual protein kinase regulating ubiquinone biosynthesis (AarF/ABC1/UbiB family)